MRQMKTIEVPARTETVIDFIQCDLCAALIERYVPLSAEDVKIEHKTGTLYPDGGDGEDRGYDICGACFEGKLVPWMEAQGAVLRVTPWDY